MVRIDPAGRFDIIILEVRVDDSFEFLATILKETDNRIPVIMMSERNDRETVAGARLGGVCKFLSKPLGEQEVQVASHLQKVEEEFRKKLQIINLDHQHPQEAHYHIHDPAAAANTSSSNYIVASALVTSPPAMDVTILIPVPMMMNNNIIINPNSQLTAPAMLDRYYIMQQPHEEELSGRELIDVEQPTITDHEINELIASLCMPIETQVNNANRAPEPEDLDAMHEATYRIQLP
ncbi:hypothetical protein Dimus_034434 [Dionaea muscipula]